MYIFEKKLKQIELFLWETSSSWALDLKPFEKEKLN